MADRDTLAVLAEELGLALRPLSDAVQSTNSFASLMNALGWDLATIPDAFAGMSAPLRTVADILEGGTIDAAAAPGLLQAIGSAFSSIDSVGSAGGLPAGMAAEMPRQLVDYLAVEYLLDYQPRVGELLKLIGVIRLQEIDAAGTRPAFLRRSIAWEDLGRMLDVPGDVFANAYHWGQADFDQISFAQNVADFARAFAIPASFTPLSPGVKAALAQGGGPLTEAHDWMVRSPLLQSDDGTAEVEAGIGMVPLPAAGGAPPGFSILPYAVGGFAGSVDLTEHVAIVLEGSFDLTGGIGILVRPNRAPEAFADLETGGSQASGEIGIGVAVHGAADEAVVVAGSKEASRVEFRSVSFMVGMRLASASTPDVYGALDLQGGKIVVKPSESDGFLAKLLPADGIVIDIALLVGLSTAQGLYFGGSGGLEVSLPAHVQLGPIEIVSATLAIKPKTGSIPLEIGATIKGELGPLKAVVENVGMRVDMTFPPGRDGNLGAVNLGLGFKPPNGVGLSIDAGVVKGGGYLFIDPDKGEYAGAIELTFANFLSLKAIGLISTKMPDGSPGFSLLVIITAEFPGGLQLGYGFKLIGVGGLLGLNRTMKLGPLMEGVRTGAIDGIMFPTDIVANAPRIISDLRAIFPPKQGTFLIGPMAKLGWCTPTLISLAVGIIIEIPGNVAIIGVIKIALPTPDEPVVVIQANFAGAIEFDRKRGFFFAALFESRILTMTLEGEMGMLIAVGEDANFVVSVGGFHPDFDAPPLPFPSPKRLALSIIDTDNARIRVEMYFAITPNTIQFGAGAELYFGFDSFSLQGHFAFDALLTFVPLSFVAQLSASVSLKAFGVGVFSVRLSLTLSGPTPWRARGKGSIQLLFFEISADFDKTWGLAEVLALGPFAVLPELLAELAKRESWRAVLPESTNLLVSLRPIDPAAGALVLHPLGALRVSQSRVPLDLTIERFGALPVADANRFELKVAGGGLERTADASEKFPAAQFLDLDDAAKLSRPAFEYQHGGIELAVGGASVASAHAVARTVRYEEVVIDTAYRRHKRRFRGFADVLFAHFLRGNSASRSTLSKRAKSELEPFATKIAARHEQYVVARMRDNRPVEDAVYASEAAAFDDLADRVASGEGDDLHVIPAFEAVGAP